MSNVLSEQAKQQVIALGRLGWSLRRIQQETGVRRKTASVYLKAAGIQVPPPGRRKQRAAKPAIPVTIGFGVEWSGLESENRTPTASTCEPFREAIEVGLSQGRNAMAIWQDLVADAGFHGSYQTVKRFVRKLRGTQPLQARAVIVTPPGEEAQVDYGSKGPMVRDAQTGKYRRTRLFVMTLGYSRKAVRLLTFRSSSRIWAELHEKAFRRLGGSPHVVVLDNLKEGVLVPDIYDPTLNPLYRDVLAHYGAVALPCRIQDPDRKGKSNLASDTRRELPSKENASEFGRSSSLSRSLGSQLRRYPHPWHHQAASGSSVHRRQTHLITTTTRALPLLPVRRAHRAPGWLRGSRCRLLQRAAGLDRALGKSTVGWPIRPSSRPQDRTAHA